jgi:hypothetical protein
MTVGKAKIGSGFGGLARYLLQGTDGQSDDRVEWTALRNLPLADPDNAAVFMRATADQNLYVQKPVYHLSINWPPEEQPTPEAMRTAADRLLRDLGLEEHQALYVAHRDTEHRHVHIMVNRVHPETLKTWSNKNDWRRIEESLRRIERDMGWRVVPGRQGQMIEAHQEDARRIRQGAWEPMHISRSWAELEDRLHRQGLALQARGRGMVATDGVHYVKASDVDRSVSRGRLEERFGMTHREWRDTVQGIQRTARDHNRLTNSKARAARSGQAGKTARAGQTAKTVNPRRLHSKATRVRHRAHQARAAAEGAGDVKALEHKLMAFATQWGMAALRRVSPAAATILWAARFAKRTLDRGVDRERGR